MGNKELKDLLQERFHGHELPVDPSLWSAIAGKLAVGAGTGAAAGDGLNKLFSDRFAGHTVEVDPSAWANISSQLGHGAAAGTGAAGAWFSGMTGWVAAGVAAVVLVGGVILFERASEADHSAVTMTASTTEMPKAPEVTPSNVAGSTVAVQQVESPGETSMSSAQKGMDLHHGQLVSPTGSGAGQQGQVSAPGDVQQPTPEAPPEDRATIESMRAATTAAEEIKNMIAEADQQTARPHDTVPDPIVAEEVGADKVDLDASREESTTLSFFLPNVFTPGGDGINDSYLPVGAGEGATPVKIRVFSVSTGELVFSADELKPWDGTNSRTGQPCPEGHYLYAIEAIGPDGRGHSQGETVRLFR